MPPETTECVIMPRDVSVEQNIAEAQDYAATHTISETYYWFYLKVRKGGGGNTSNRADSTRSLAVGTMGRSERPLTFRMKFCSE